MFQNKKRVFPLTLLLPFLFSSPLEAEVVDSAANGFNIEISMPIEAEPPVAYVKFTRDLSLWWDSGHTFSGNSKNLSLDPKPNGCFCETLPLEGGVRHMTVVYAEPGKRLNLTGGLGPLQELATTGSMSIVFEENGDQTNLKFAYRVSGYFKEGLDSFASIVDSVLKEQLDRFKAFVETGNPTPGQ